MKDRKQIALPSSGGQLPMFLNPSRVLRLEMATSEAGYKEGVVVNIGVEHEQKVVVKCRYDNGTVARLSLYYRAPRKGWETTSGSRKLVCYEAESASPMATPVEPAKPKEEFSDKGIMPSDHPGINEYMKKGFKEIFGQPMPAPAKRTLPSSKALFITASEKYMGLGFNDEMGRDVQREVVNAQRDS